MKNTFLNWEKFTLVIHKMKFFCKRILSKSKWLIIFLFFPLVVSAQDTLGNILSNPILGEHKMLFIRVIYPDDSQVILTAAAAVDHAQNLNAIFKANSYDQLDLVIDITPVLTMPQPKSFYLLDNRLSYVRIRADAINIAEDAGFPESDYDREIIFTKKLWPQPFFGVGYINLRTSYMALDNPTLSAHEVGHTLDWRHAKFWRVNSANPIDTAGVLIDYGDKFDIMGDYSNFHHFNPWYKWRVGWIPAESILTVADSGIYCIRALENLPLSGPTVSEYSALRIRRTPDTDYWMFYRSNENLANNGAIITQIQPRNNSSSILLDMEPGSMPEMMDYQDAALVPGKIVQDQEAGIEIEVLELYNDSLKVRVVVPQNPIDSLPVIDIVNPELGPTISGTIDYEATAYDPDVGQMNGAGIDTVQFILGYLVGDDPQGAGTPLLTLGTKVLTSPPYIYQVDTDTLPDEVYRLIVRAISKNGGTNLAVINHIIDNTGPSVPTAVEKEPVSNKFQLRGNYPNPFKTSTTINYYVGTAGKVELNIYNLLGMNIRNLVKEIQPPGEYSIIWNGGDDSGKLVPSGSYFCELRAGKLILTKMLLLQN